MLDTALTLAAYLYVIGVAILLIWEDCDPTTTLAWLLVLIFLPVVGVPLYVLFGRDWRWRARANRVHAEVDALSRSVLGPIREANEALVFSRDPRATPGEPAKVAASIEEMCDAEPLPADTVEIIASGEEKFARLIADIEAARDSVHLQYFIWECDELTRRVIDALIRKLAEGVEVRLKYDFVGSLPYGKRQLRRLARAGAQVRADRTNLNLLNYRNHRKIVVIDGAIGYTGGFNVGQEYVDGGARFASWRDTHLRITGPFVAELQRLFAARWYETAGESLFCSRHFPPAVAADPATAVIAQIEHSSFESEWEAIRLSFILAIASANERVWISSPYFVPDQGVYDAIVAAALSGVDVRIIITGHPDKRVAWWAAHSYFPRLLQAGGRIYLYQSGFYHPKALSVDGRFCTIGTTNLDTRSMSLHDEMNVWLFDEALTRRQDSLFEADMAQSREVTLADVRAYSGAKRLRDSIMRLGAKVL